jgi:hypothetical protein
LIDRGEIYEVVVALGEDGIGRAPFFRCGGLGPMTSLESLCNLHLLPVRIPLLE